MVAAEVCDEHCDGRKHTQSAVGCEERRWILHHAESLGQGQGHRLGHVVAKDVVGHLNVCVHSWV